MLTLRGQRSPGPGPGGTPALLPDILWTFWPMFSYIIEWVYHEWTGHCQDLTVLWSWPVCSWERSTPLSVFWCPARLCPPPPGKDWAPAPPRPSSPPASRTPRRYGWRARRSPACSLGSCPALLGIWSKGRESAPQSPPLFEQILSRISSSSFWF